MRAWRRPAGLAREWAARWGRHLGLLPYKSERWTTEQWDAAYSTGGLGYYGGLDELARYSVIVGYINWHCSGRPESPPRILDVGCGIGLLRERLGDGAFSQYVGVDLSGAAIGVATSRLFSRSRFLVGDVLERDIGTFDLVVLNEVLYYVADTTVFLDGIRSVLHPDGLLLVSMWRHPGDRALWRRVDDALPLLDRVEVRNPANPVNPKGWIVALYQASAGVSKGDPQHKVKRVW